MTNVSVTIPASEFLLGDEAVRLLRQIRQAYCEDAKLWGTPGVGEDDARRFMRAYEAAMVAVSPMLQERIMAGGAHSGPNQCDGCRAGVPVVDGMHRMGKPGGYPDYMGCQSERYDDPDGTLPPILGIR